MELRRVGLAVTSPGFQSFVARAQRCGGVDQQPQQVSELTPKRVEPRIHEQE
ncbi:MAG: hypothetical protein O3A00_09655 [Planctomycetota bacterium]|nr:hypothetical protein [Planctomycetota bacterium]